MNVIIQGGCIQGNARCSSCWPIARGSITALLALANADDHAVRAAQEELDDPEKGAAETHRQDSASNRGPLLVSQAITGEARTFTAADLEPEGPTTLVISWRQEPGTAVGPEWASELAHQIRRLGGALGDAVLRRGGGRS